MRDARFFNFLAAGDLRLLGLGVAQRPLAGEFGALYRAPHFDVAFLIEARGLAFAVDIQRLLLGFEIAAADQDHRFLLDVVAQLAAGFDVLDQLGQAFRVEAIRRIEEFEVSLIEIGDRDRFKLEAVLRQSFQSGFFHTRDVVVAALMHFFHGHFGGDRAQRRNELAGEKRIELGDVHGAAAERGGGDGHRLAGRRHAHVEFGLDVDAHPVLGDQRVVAVAHHLHAQDVHVDRRDFVNERKHEGAAVDDHFFAERGRCARRRLPSMERR